MKPSVVFLPVLFFLAMAMVSCQEAVEHTAPAVRDRDSADVMRTYGVNTLISDSGVIKYRIVTEAWEVNQVKHPSRWTFDKGLFLEQFDEHFHVQAYIQCDTAYYFDQQRLWELRSNVRVLTKDGLRFSSERLYWDEMAHELYSNVYSKLVTPDRTLEGNRFTADEKMTHYNVTYSRGSFERQDLEPSQPKDSAEAMRDSVLQQRGRAIPVRNH